MMFIAILIIGCIFYSNLRRNQLENGENRIYKLVSFVDIIIHY